MTEKNTRSTIYFYALLTSIVLWLFNRNPAGLGSVITLAAVLLFEMFLVDHIIKLSKGGNHNEQRN